MGSNGMHVSRRMALGLLSTSVVAGCSRLELLDAVAPRDSGGSLVAKGVPYGPDERQKLDIYAPPNPVRAPVIIFVYGGSWQSGDRVDYGFLATSLAAQGFVTVIPDYRLVPQVRFPAFVEDGAAATAWVTREIHKHGGDGSRIVISGHSAGAHIAAMVSLAPSYLKAAGAVNKLRGFAGLAGPYDFLPFEYRTIIDAFGNWPRPEETQPVRFVSQGAPPALLLHGRDDTTVLPRQTISLADRLKAAGNDVELKIYENVDHIDIMLALSRPFRDSANTLADLTGFARRVTA